MCFAKVGVSLTPHGVEINFEERKYAVDQAFRSNLDIVGIQPAELLLASLGACTLNTVKTFADQKGWKLSGLDIDLRLIREKEKISVERILAATGQITEEEREQLLEVAEATPMTMAIQSGVAIRTELA